MIERQDIDALLIGALYGELTPAEEKQLTVHLETHPGDRTALDGLTRARAALHESRILTVQLDPPQSVSALLLQEAHRRAPRSVADGEGWFAQFLRSFVQHPAMAAAAMLVIVVGFAAIVGRNKGSMSADHTVESAPMAAQSAGSSAPAVALDDQQFNAPAATAPAEGGELRGGAAGSGSTALGGVEQGVADGRMTNTEAYKVDLAPSSETRARDLVAMKEEQAKEKLSDGVVVNRKTPAPKELDAKPKGSANVSADPAGGFAESEAKQQRQELAYGAAASPGGPAGGEPRSAAPSPPPAPPAVTTSSRPMTAPTKPEPAPAKALKKADSDDAASIAKDSTADKKAGETKSDAESAWARQQHQALIAAVKSNDCPRAANIAVSIEQRAPGYYAANVATDRGTKDCRAYIAQRREQTEASDRMKARSLDEPSPTKAGKKAATTKSKAVDKPAAAETTK